MSDLPQELRSHRLKFRTSMAKGKMYASSSHGSDGGKEGKWTTKHDRPLRLPVRNRYAQNLVVEFRTHSTFRDKTPAFAILWLHAIPDDEEQDLELIVWKGDLARAETNVLAGEQCGEKLGILRVKLTFYRGIGKWHAPMSKRSAHVHEMLEVLMAANDENLIDCVVGDDAWLRKQACGELDDGLGGGGSDSDTSDDDIGTKDDKADGTITGNRASTSFDGAEARELKRADKENNHGSVGGLIGDIKEYAKNKTELHRKHRGIMQWKVGSHPDNPNGNGNSPKHDTNPLHALKKLGLHGLHLHRRDHKDHNKHLFALLKRVNGRLAQANTPLSPLFPLLQPFLPTPCTTIRQKLTPPSEK